MKSSLDIPECVFLVYGPFRAGIEDLFFYLYLIGHLSISNNSSLLFQVTDYPYYPASGTSVKYDGQKSKVYSGMSKNCQISLYRVYTKLMFSFKASRHCWPIRHCENRTK